MSNKKPKGKTAVTPKGLSKYAWLNKPDNGFDGKGDPTFKARILIEDTEENREWCDSVIAKGKESAKEQKIKLRKNFKTPFNFPEDQDEDDFVPEEGKDKPRLDEDHKDKIFFEVKSKFKPALIDAMKSELPEDVLIMSGDIVRAKFELVPYEGLGSGLSFRVKTVQLIEKNTAFSGGGADTDGFDEEEDGYVAKTNDDDEDEDDDEIPF